MSNTATTLLKKWASPTYTITTELVPALQDEPLTIRQLTVGEAGLVTAIKDEYEQSIAMFAYCVIDSKGKTIFTKEQVEDIPQAIVTIVATTIQYYTHGIDAQALDKLLEAERDERDPFTALEREELKETLTPKKP